jgi:aspartate/methionine/tyrosine aminotransferase
MKLEPFALERHQSIWENRVAWNVSESGVQPLRVMELADTDALRDALLAQELGYPQTNGTIALRGAIAALYEGATLDHVQVTNGGSEANCIVLMHIVQPGDEIIVMTPIYMQAPGLVRALGATVRPWPLRIVGDGKDARWRPDVEELRSLVTARTRALLICNPNNPTGARFDAPVLDEIARVADRAGAWIVSDEIYRGAERETDETPTMWGRAERVIVTSGLSKAYGLPGLRIGWVTGPPATIEALWGIHDYTTIAPGAINDRLAAAALAPERRARLLARTRAIIRANYPIVRQWAERHGLTHVPPEAGAIAWLRYHGGMNSTALVNELREAHGVLLVPGDHFDMDGYLRIGFGSDPAHLTNALNLAGQFLESGACSAEAPAAQRRIDAR